MPEDTSFFLFFKLLLYIILCVYLSRRRVCSLYWNTQAMPYSSMCQLNGIWYVIWVRRAELQSLFHSFCSAFTDSVWESPSIHNCKSLKYISFILSLSSQPSITSIPDFICFLFLVSIGFWGCRISCASIWVQELSSRFCNCLCREREADWHWI